MNILMVSAPYETTPPEGYGGIETVVAWYVRELVNRGHDVTTVAVKGSELPGNVIEWDPGALEKHGHIREPVFAEFMEGVIERTKFDVLHDHTHFKYPSQLAMRLGRPFVNTVHLPSPPFKKNAVALSRAHKTTVSPRAVVIHLGVPVEDYPFVDKKKNYLLYLGYIAPHKQVHQAIIAAKELKKRMIVAGPYDFFPEYFETQIEPRLDTRRVYMGPVYGEKKLKLLSRASALVLPIGWVEPGSTVCFEALACGTPVIGYRQGALIDILEPVGGLVNTYDDMLMALENLPTNYQALRDYVAANYSIESRIDQYELVYARAISGEIW